MISMPYVSQTLFFSTFATTLLQANRTNHSMMLHPFNTIERPDMLKRLLNWLFPMRQMQLDELDRLIAEQKKRLEELHANRRA